MSKPLVDGIKEFFRILVIALLPALIVQLENGGFNWEAIALVVVIAVLKAVDEFMHETGKLEANEALTKGLTRF